MALPVGDDIMLNYQSTSFHDIPSVRRLARQAPDAGVRRVAQRRAASSTASEPGRTVRRSDGAPVSRTRTLVAELRAGIGRGRSAPAAGAAPAGPARRRARLPDAEEPQPVRGRGGAAHDRARRDRSRRHALRDRRRAPVPGRARGRARGRRHDARRRLGRGARLPAAPLARAAITASSCCVPISAAASTRHRSPRLREARHDVDVQPILADGLSAQALPGIGARAARCVHRRVHGARLDGGHADVREVRARLARGRDRPGGRREGRGDPARRAARPRHRRRAQSPTSCTGRRSATPTAIGT